MSKPSDRELWIVVNGWETFQHYRERRPVWIKNYVDLTRRDDYLSLTGHRRAILHGIWLEYASTHSRLRVDTQSLSRRLHLRVTDADMLSIHQAGFISFSASAPLALGYQDASLETETEKETPLPPSERPKTKSPSKSKTPPTCPIQPCGVTWPTWKRIREHVENAHWDVGDETSRDQLVVAASNGAWRP